MHLRTFVIFDLGALYRQLVQHQINSLQVFLNKYVLVIIEAHDRLYYVSCNYVLVDCL